MKNVIRSSWARYNALQLAEKSAFSRLLDWMPKADPTEETTGLPLVDLSFSFSVKLHRLTSGGYRRISCHVDTQIQIET